MKLRIGYDIGYFCPQATPIILTLNVHPSRVADLLSPDQILTTPAVPHTGYHDSYGNWCTRLEAPAGSIRITANSLIQDQRLPDPWVPDAVQHPVTVLPTASLLFLLGSRYCETDLLSEFAWGRFGHLPKGWTLVQAICDFVHAHIQFDYMRASASKTALQVLDDRIGVCRDYTHLAITLCRCLNIPARYCTGYLSDVGLPPPYGTMDFAAWMEVYLGDGWHVFDPRNNQPSYGRVLIARGRDAADVAISSTFGKTELQHFKVWADEIDQD